LWILSAEVAQDQVNFLLGSAQSNYLMQKVHAEALPVSREPFHGARPSGMQRQCAVPSVLLKPWRSARAREISRTVLSRSVPE